MGAKQSTFLYSPLEFAEWKDKYPNENLRSFLVWRLESLLITKLTAEWNNCIESMNHKIRCISEGWDVMPKIHFDIIKLTNGLYLPRVQKILPSV